MDPSLQVPRMTILDSCKGLLQKCHWLIRIKIRARLKIGSSLADPMAVVCTTATATRLLGGSAENCQTQGLETLQNRGVFTVRTAWHDTWNILTTRLLWISGREFGQLCMTRRTFCDHKIRAVIRCSRGSEVLKLITLALGIDSSRESGSK